ncbi:environmental stress-induced protein Ves [Nocardioides sp. BE266]|uniref:HutD/Ves family protein n=1 Tax=Nocardioides sp. BE266 TaxID=2817725 RepID=UPI0028617C0C|nr:HutD family protein [Nocardioides sp. BE266]MDR7251100.1 environmental stress-induced protein Ves [Nocardioides sp. BE266]
MSGVVRSDEVTPQPWANGGGTTRELARADDGAWRISLADIDADGPFSTFAGRHRLLTVVDGPVLGLEVDGETQVVEPHRPFAFSGDATVEASVPEGAVRVLNVIVDPAVVSPFVTVLELGRSSALPLADDQAAFVVKGDGVGSLVLGPGEVAGRCTVAVVTLEHV